ncbi:phosphoadenosine phosphosulfate reductase family protein [Noviherbaspirillum saxi]|uniref:Phosphoadenosine phosphosulfate reductase n=1 Tax=Noviherbaspirillum saxi TaxID=2320863 RepID=A0A3A3FWM3_9BURK|nr:phosphoadenosine phosphosulfate reductase family protein [Noviherbaspirillum saxi]RJF99038.1 phosphoadenosine phosphosulfate reductase [Noviherbaspirillum saxi]
MSVLHVVSVSGGKDSLSTLLIALERFGKHRTVPIFCDTGNEHEAVYEYLAYLEERLGIQIIHLKANFDAEIAAKRMFIARDVRHRRVYDTESVFDDLANPVWKRDGRGNIVTRTLKRGDMTIDELVQKTKKIGGGRKVRWTNKAKRRALEVLHPTGNPYLDLCLWKGRFPSRKAQFCTEFLKRNPAVEHQLSLMDQGHTVVSWQGIRRDESDVRKNAKKFESVGGGLYIYRPIVEWTVQDVFRHAEMAEVKPNPLYLQGMGRVGCMPCINASKAELNEIGKRFPLHVARIHEWEQRVSRGSKRQAATFIPAPGIKTHEAKEHGIYAVIQWARTERGGKFIDTRPSLFAPTECASAYGLCE